MKSIFCLCILLATGFSQLAFAAEGKHHFPGIFIGYTDAKNETEFTYGLEYEYRFDTHWGVGAVYERIDDAHHGDGVTVTLASLYYHPTQDFRLGLGAGREKIGGDHPHSENLVRVSAAYDFHFGEIGVAPTLAVDFIDGEKAYVAGVAFIFSF